VAVGPVFEIGSSPPVLLKNFQGFNAATDAIGFNRTQDGWFERVHLGSIGSGANLAVRRSVFDRHGLFREGLGAGAPIGGDETYFLLSAVELGETVVNEPLARVYHPVQSAQRLEELVQCRAAYVLYVAINCPGVRWRLIKSLRLLLLRRRHAAPLSASAGASSRIALIKVLVRALVLFKRARRMDHGK
jgi:hypothetical protein